jgi:hypothetical protein
VQFFPVDEYASWLVFITSIGAISDTIMDAGSIKSNRGI